MPRAKTPISVRLERRRTVDPQGCWIWTGRCNNGGYGQMTIDHSTRLVHRVAYAHYVGMIPTGLVIDHLCRQRACFNPEHLEPVTPRENVMRSPVAIAAVNAAKTHCPQGHEYSPENTYFVSGGRLCAPCNSASHARMIARKRAASSNLAGQVRP